MVCLAQGRGYQLRNGERWVGSALGSLLAWSSLLMRDWHEEDPDEEAELTVELGVLITVYLACVGGGLWSLLA